MSCTNGPWFIGQSLDGRNAIIGDVDSVVAYLPGGEDGCTYKVDDAKQIAAVHLLIEALEAIAGPTACAMDSADRVEAYRDIARDALANAGSAS